MAVQQQRVNVSYGLSQPLINTPNFPIVSNRSPRVTDFAPIGSLWVNRTTNQAYILVQVANNSATWNLLDVAAGGGNFANLTVTPGPTSLTGVTNINTAGAGVTTIGTGGTGAVAIGNTTGNTAVTGDINVTSGSVNLATAGEGFQANPSVSAAGASPRVVNAIHGQAIFTDVIADSASATLTVTNSEVTVNSQILPAVSCATVGAKLTIGTITPGAGSVAFVVNNVSADTSTADNIIITFWIVN